MRSQVIDELQKYLFDEKPHPLAAQMAIWLASSRRFTAFVTAFQTKIRKKLRVPQELESQLDLQFELETAYLLLEERSLSLVYEPLPIGQSRSPDFAVSFTTSTIFMIEVTRLRMGQEIEKRLVDLVCGKLGQLRPLRGNILLVGVEVSGLQQESLRAAVFHLQQRAEQNDAAIVQRHGFRDRADFFQHYLRLSELIVRGPRLQTDAPAISWVNPQAKYPLPAKVRTALYRSLAPK